MGEMSELSEVSGVSGLTREAGLSGFEIPGAAKYFHPRIWITTGIFKDAVISIMATIGKQLIITVNNTGQV
jgi:hypothetical protein